MHTGYSFKKTVVKHLQMLFLETNAEIHEMRQIHWKDSGKTQFARTARQLSMKAKIINENSRW